MDRYRFVNLLEFIFYFWILMFCETFCCYSKNDGRSKGQRNKKSRTDASLCKYPLNSKLNGNWMTFENCESEASKTRSLVKSTFQTKP